MKDFSNYIKHLKQMYRNLRIYYYCIYRKDNQYSKFYFKLYLKVFFTFLFSGPFEEVYNIKIKNNITFKSKFDNKETHLSVSYKSVLESILSNNGFKIISEFLTCEECNYFFNYE